MISYNDSTCIIAHIMNRIIVKELATLNNFLEDDFWLIKIMECLLCQLWWQFYPNTGLNEPLQQDNLLF